MHTIVNHVHFFGTMLIISVSWKYGRVWLCIQMAIGELQCWHSLECMWQVMFTHRIYNFNECEHSHHCSSAPICRDDSWGSNLLTSYTFVTRFATPRIFKAYNCGEDIENQITSNDCNTISELYQCRYFAMYKLVEVLLVNNGTDRLRI